MMRKLFKQINDYDVLLDMRDELNNLLVKKKMRKGGLEG